VSKLALGPPDRGVLYVVSGPSGVGKSTLIRRAMERIPGLSFSVSATTREARAGERHGVHYYFMDQENFEEKRRAGDFLEYATVYDRSYGTLREPVELALASGQSLILDIDVQGSKQLRVRLPEAVHILIVPPTISSLLARLRARATDSEDVISRRMAQLAQQLVPNACDFIVVNDDLDTAHAAFEGVLIAEMCRRHRRASFTSRLLSEVPPT
jgi:guanylate kinase